MAVARSQAPFTSIRILPEGPRADRTAAIRSSSSMGDWPGSATLTLSVRHPDPATMAKAVGPSTAGTVTLIGTDERTGAGQTEQAASRAAASHLVVTSGG